MYIPEQGNIIKLNFNPIKGHEQGGYRPAVVITKKIYNSKSNTILICPITSKIKNYPYEVTIEMEGFTDNDNLGLVSDISGVVLTDHIKSADYKARKVNFSGRLKEIVVWNILAKIKTLID
ncbi:MAG: type II toxin-antitoxin system PemK/MazF family toxin [bacterium]